MFNKYKNIDPVVKTTDEHGNIHNFKLIEIVEVNKNEYGLFEYIEPDENTAPNTKQEEEIVIMKIINKNNEFFFEIIDDDNEFEEVLSYIEAHEEELEI